MSDAPLISLRGLTRRFANGAESVTVLDDVNLDIEAGEMISIVGQSATAARAASGRSFLPTPTPSRASLMQTASRRASRPTSRSCSTQWPSMRRSAVSAWIIFA